MQRDQPLSLRWRGITDDQLVAIGLGLDGGPNRCACRRGVVAHLLLAHRSDQWVSYSRNHNHYVGRRRYEGAAYTCQNVLTVVEELNALDLIDEERAWPGRLGRQSRIKATPRMVAALGHVDQLQYAAGEVIRLKDAAGRLVDYTDTPFTHEARRQVDALNEAFRSVRIVLAAEDVAWNAMAVRIDGQIVHPARVVGHRVFNGNWDSGGRLYGMHWQGLSKRRRRQLTIDGAKVIEHDFPQLHPRLLYAGFGRALESDAYTLAGYEQDRPSAKQAWQILINARSRQQAVLALATELGGSQFKVQAARLLDALEERHRAIAAAFYTGIGLRLQRLDADLMLDILQQCLAEGIVVLPVHDSLIVAKGAAADRAQEIMNAKLERLLYQLHENTRIFDITTHII